MIPVILQALRAAGGRTAVLVLLGALPVAAAVAGPAYVAAAQRSIVASQVAAAAPGETVLSLRRVDNDAAAQGDTFERLGGAAFHTPGFEPVFGTAFEVAPPTVDLAWRLSYRDRVCAHVSFDAGRCPTGRGEIMLGFRSAEVMRAGVGDAIAFRQAEFAPAGGGTELTRVGDPVTLSVVGIYRPVDPTAAYWGSSSPFPPGLLTNPELASELAGTVGTEPVYGSRATARLFALQVPEAQSYDLVADPRQLTADRVDRHPAELDRLGDQAEKLGADLVPGTEPLMTRIEASRSAVRSLVPWLALSVVPLCWFVIVIAAAAGADARRTELGQLALRGMPAPHRWWLAAGPDVLALLAGAPLGFVAGQVAGALAVPGSRLVWGLAGEHWRYGLVALAGALLAATLAARGLVAARAIDLLRRVTRQGGAWRSATAETTVVALAAVAVFEARTEAGPVRGGLAILAPVLLMVAGALLAARLLGPAARRAGTRALRTGQLARALAGIELSRRPAPRRAATLAALGVALLCFAVLAVDHAGAARAGRAGIELGADRVLTVNQLTGGALRAAVRSADPEGRWAMAVVSVPATGSGPATVAADSDRLDAVAWPGSLPPGMAAKLRPAQSPSLTLAGNRIRVDATVTARGSRLAGDPELRAVVQAVGEAERTVPLGPLRGGRVTYEAGLPRCEPACRLIAVEVESLQSAVTLTVHEISQTSPDRVVADASVLGDAERWRGATEDGQQPSAPTLTPTPDGVAVHLGPMLQGQRLAVADTPAVLPVFTTTSVTPRETGTGWAVASPGRPTPAPATSVASLPTLPGVGATGMLVDLEYLDRAAPMGPGGRPQVWLAADAPPDALGRLSRAGITALTDTSAAGRARLADRDGAALAGRYGLVTAGFAILLVLLGLGLIAATETRDRALRTRALRVQGLPAATLDAATRRQRVWPVLTGVVLGPLLALAAWAAAAPATPVFLDTGWPLAFPVLPSLPVFGVVWAGGAVSLLAVALVRWRRSG